MIVRGVIRYFNPATYLAAVELGGSMATAVEAIPVATHIRQELVVAGRKCGVALFDPNNPSDACVVFVYGAVNPGHITIDQGYEFRPGGDANSAFGEDATGNAYLKDANEGKKILRQMASVSQRATATAGLTLTTTIQDIPGCSLSLGEGTWIVWGIIDFDCPVFASTNPASGYLNVGGADQASQVIMEPSGVGRCTAAQVWRITLASITTVKLRAKKAFNVGTHVANSIHTSITAMRTGD